MAAMHALTASVESELTSGKDTSSVEGFNTAATSNRHTYEKVREIRIQTADICGRIEKQYLAGAID